MSLTYLVLLAVMLLIVYCIYCRMFKSTKSPTTEKWVDYKMLPYGSVREGTDPVHYYRRDRYRKPYRYGFKFAQSYPYNHYEPLP